MSTHINALDSIRRALMTRLPGATDDLVNQELRWALQEFLSFTQVWRTTETSPLVDGVTDYQIPMNVGNPSAVAETILAGWVVRPAPDAGNVSLRVAVDLSVELALMSTAGTPDRVELVAGTHLRVSPRPDAQISAGGSLVAYLVMSLDPSLPLTELPASVIPYTDAILSGTLARMHAMDAKPWTSPILVRFHTGRFHAMKTNARAAANAGRSNQAAPRRFPRFGA